MFAIAEIIRRHVLLLLSALLLLLSFQLMGLSVRNPLMAGGGVEVVSFGLAPLRQGYHELVQTSGFYLNRYFFLWGIEAERNILLSRVKELEAANSFLIEAQEENHRLKSLLQFSRISGHRGVVASIVGRNPSPWIGTLIIDRGANDGIRSGLPVVDGKAVVGQTTVVTADTSVVLLIEDSSSSVAALIQESRNSGILEGTGIRVASNLPFSNYGPLASEARELKLKYMIPSEDSPTKIGDRVVTSGLDGVFPKGLVLGVVHEVGRGRKSSNQEIVVRPAVNLAQLESVMVLIPEKQTVSNFKDLATPPSIEMNQEDIKHRAQCVKFVGAVARQPGVKVVKASSHADNKKEAR